MDRRLALGLAFASLVLVGCPRRPPRTAAEPPPVPASAPPPASYEYNDATEQPLPSDLRELNELLAERGLLGDIYFAFDESTLDDAATARLARNAEFLRSQADLDVAIEGHCDERGTNDYNLALGARRAAAAREYLVALGLGADRLQSTSFGEERPQCVESGETCWSRNRRAHFIVVGRRGG